MEGTKTLNKYAQIEHYRPVPELVIEFFSIIRLHSGANVLKTVGDLSFFLSLRSRMENLSVCKV